MTGGPFIWDQGELDMSFYKSQVAYVAQGSKDLGLSLDSWLIFPPVFFVFPKYKTINPKHSSGYPFAEHSLHLLKLVRQPRLQNLIYLKKITKNFGLFLSHKYSPKKIKGPEKCMKKNGITKYHLPNVIQKKVLLSKFINIIPYCIKE